MKIEPRNQSQIDFFNAVKAQSIVAEDDTLIIGARFQLSFNNAGGVTIDDMRVPDKLQRHKKRKGLAKERAIPLSDFGLSEITTQADKFGVTLYLDAVALNDIPTSKLRDIYKRHGFKGSSGWEMRRDPQQTPAISKVHSPKLEPLAA